MTTLATCSNPGCDQPGINKCSACKTTPYCGPICQTADWHHHKEECPGHLRKVGVANLAKAEGFHRQQNWQQTLRHAELAATKLKQLKDRPVEDIDGALSLKFNALNFMARYREALECAKEWYCLWPTKHTHPPAIRASFAVIESCIFNKEFFDAALYARTLWETITLSRDSHIPDDLREAFTARGAKELASATLHLAQNGGIPVDEQKAAGVEAIMLARRALDIHTHLYGIESAEVADDTFAFANVLGFFSDVNDDEVLRLFEQAKVIYARVYGSLSLNVAICEKNLGVTYENRAKGAHAAHDLDRYVANLELVLTRYREAARIYRAINHVDQADKTSRAAVDVEDRLRRVVAVRAAANTG